MQSLPETPKDPSAEAAPYFDPVAAAKMQAGLNLQQAYNSAGGNFNAIALFSFINSVITYLNFGIYFPVGLAITQLVDAFSQLFQAEFPENGAVYFVIGIVLDLFIVGLVALFGFLIKKKNRWLVVIGGVLYLLDALLSLLFQDWIGAAFHAYFLYQIWKSWQAIQQFTPKAPQSAIEYVP